MKKLLFLLMMLSSPAWAAYPNYIVSPTGGDFTSLNGAVADIKTNHATLSSPVTIVITGTWASADTTSVDLSGITTSGTNTITISTSGAAIHPGYFTDASPYYRLITTNTDGIALNNSFVNIIGLQIETNVATSNNGRPIDIASGISNITIDRTIMTAIGTAGDVAFRGNSGGAGSSWLIKNSIMESNGSESAYIEGTSMEFDNDIFITYSSAAALRCVDTPVVKNSYAYSQSGVAYDTCLSPVTSYSSDGSQGTTTAAYSTSSGAFFTNVTPGSENFSISLGSALIGSGTNLFSTFTDDIVGATRQSSAPWDVGPFLFGSVVGPTSTTVINNAVLRNVTIN